MSEAGPTNKEARDYYLWLCLRNNCNCSEAQRLTKMHKKGK